MSLFVFVVGAAAQTGFDNKPIGNIDVPMTGGANPSALEEQFRLLVREAVGPTYSAPRIRDAVEALYNTKKIDTVTVSAKDGSASTVDLVFAVKLKIQAQKVVVEVGEQEGDKITEQDLLYRLNLLTPGMPVTDQDLKDNADEVLDYLRDRGFYKSTVTYTKSQLANGGGTAITFHVDPNTQAQISVMSVRIEGFSKPIPPDTFKLETGEPYSKDRLNSDVSTLKDVLRKEDFLAPELDDPDVRYDREKNTIAVTITGKVGPKVDIALQNEKGPIKSSAQLNLIPVRTEGTLDYSAIVEGQRKLENYYQEQGYFFASATPICSVTPQLTDTENNLLANGTAFVCQFMGGEDLMGKGVSITYNIAEGRKFKLTSIRIRGTDKFTFEDVKGVLKTQTANALGIIPFFGYGNGYTSDSILDDDTETLRSLMREMGYLGAEVHANRGVSPTSDDLIITFVVDEGIPTVVDDVAITGNKAVPEATLKALLPSLTGRNLSFARVRTASRAISEYYSQQGYYYARVVQSVSENPTKSTPEKRSVTVQFKVEDEGKQVEVGRVLVTGNEHTKTGAIDKTLTLRTGELLTSADVYTSEQNLYQTDAFSRVDIKPQEAGTAPDGRRLNDVIVNVEEQPSRLLSYGGGYSTDLGASGFVDIRHVNLLRNLWQGGARIAVSQRQQLVQFSFVQPRFLHDGGKRFSPLTISAQYQRDSTVTRFFRSTFDRGTFGIVERVDDKGNPIDQFGARVGSPTINRLTLSAEASRTISRASREIVFFRYRFEDVRLINIESLVIKDLLRPDQRTRISGFSSTFVRDTRENCSATNSFLDLLAKGDAGDPCKYDAADPTRGDYLTADYSVSLPALGANIGFSKFQANYNFYYSIPGIRFTILAARLMLGVANVFSGGNRFTDPQLQALNGVLPISERFFAGGADSLRGFEFDEAGPRIAVAPQGIFRDSKGNQVFLDPFTVPFGGNGLAVANIEARIPLSNSLKVVPFYDGGNVFLKAGDIFHRSSMSSNDITQHNLAAHWTHSIGLGFRLKTPIGGEFGIDYAHLLNPPIFLIPQAMGPNAQFQLRQDHIHFRFSQAF